DDADLPARLYGERLLDAVEGVCDTLEFLEPLQVIRDDLASCARARGADRVRGRNERAGHRHRLDVTVVTDDAVDDRLREAVPLEELATDDGVRALDLVVDRLADVVQQTRSLHGLHVVAALAREHARDVRDLDGVSQNVLAVRRAEVQPAEVLHEIGVEAGDPDLVDGGLGGLLHDLVDLGLRLRDHLLDARGVDAPVDEESLEGALRDLTADRVESGHDDRLRSVVDDQIDPGEGLEGPDVAALAADDPALHVVARKRHDRHRVLGRVLGRKALDGHGDDVPRLRVGALPRLGLELADATVRQVLHLLLD